MTNNEIAAIVFNEVKNEYGVTAFQLYSKTRLLHIRESRQVFSHLMRKHTDMTLLEIGKLINTFSINSDEKNTPKNTHDLIFLGCANVTRNDEHK